MVAVSIGGDCAAGFNPEIVAVPLQLPGYPRLFWCRYTAEALIKRCMRMPTTPKEADELVRANWPSLKASLNGCQTWGRGH
jgi:hypothetical protein